MMSFKNKLMSENYQLALQLLIVGMLSVFFILGIVVTLGKTLIFAVNKFSPEVKPSFIAANKELTEISLEGPEKVILEDLMAIPEEWDVTHTLFSEETYDLLVLLDY